MLAEIRDELEEEERRIIRHVLRIDERHLHTTRSKIERSNAFLVFRFVSATGRHCPFEFHFGRGEEKGRFNLYIGLGAEWYNYESIAEDPEMIADDLDCFLRSVVRCERVVGKRGVAVERYSFSKLMLDTGPLVLTYRNHYIGPFSRSETETVEYEPWIGDGPDQTTASAGSST
jgi:hypothetical protein